MARLPLNAMPEDISDYIATASVGERGFPSGTQEQISALASYIADNTDEVMGQFAEIAPDARRQNLLIAVSEFMTPESYLQFLNELLDKFQAGDVLMNAGVIERALDAGTKKMGFLAFNFQHQAVVDLCQKAKDALPPTSRMQLTLDNILSGDQKTQIGATLFMESLPQPEVLPVEGRH